VAGVWAVGRVSFICFGSFCVQLLLFLENPAGRTPKNRQASLFLAPEKENLLNPTPAPPPKKSTCNYWHGVVDSAHTNRKVADGEAFCRFCISDRKFQ